MSTVQPYKGTTGFHKSCFLLQRLEEIMRRTRRTDSADTVKFTVLFLKMTSPLGPYDAYPESTDKHPPLLLNTNSGYLTKDINSFSCRDLNQ